MSPSCASMVLWEQECRGRGTENRGHTEARKDTRERAATRCGAASLSGCEARLLSERNPSLSPPSLRLNGEETSLPSRSDVSPFTNMLVRVHRCYTMHSMHERASLFELREDWENRSLPLLYNFAFILAIFANVSVSLFILSPSRIRTC